MKICCSCKESKCVSAFYKNRSREDGVQAHCKDCNKKHNYKYKHSPKGREVRRKAVKKYQQSPKGREASRKADKKYYQSVKGTKAIRERQNKYYHKRKAVDSLFKLRRNLSALIYTSLKNKGYRKNSRTHELLGADFETVQQHLIQTAIKNYGKYFPNRPYHIDHITPCASATSESELIKLQHYTNLQFLYPKDNLSKSDNINFTPIRR